MISHSRRGKPGRGGTSPPLEPHLRRHSVGSAVAGVGALRYISRDPRRGGWSGCWDGCVHIYSKFTGKAVVEGIRVVVVRELS